MKTANRCPASAFALPTVRAKCGQVRACAGPTVRSTKGGRPTQLQERSKGLQQSAAGPSKRRSVLDLVSGMVEINVSAAPAL